MVHGQLFIPLFFMLEGLFCTLCFKFILLSAQVGYLHLCRTTLNVPLLVVVQNKTYKKNFLEYINSIDHCITFTMEETRLYESMPFLDTLVMPESDRTLPFKV